MTLKYTTVKKFWETLGINESSMEFSPGTKPRRETVETGDSDNSISAGAYYLSHAAVNEDTLVLYVGATSTALTISTDYTFDSDTSKITLTSSGATALGTSDLTAEYEYCSLSNLTYNITTRLLQAAENEFEDDTDMFFSSLTDANYRKIINEEIPLLKKAYRYKTDFVTVYNPLFYLETTTSGAFTTGGTEITLTSSTGLPSSGTLYIGGNKVAYTGLSGTTLTVPSSTPSISSGAVVVPFVMEVSLESEGNTPSWTVLDYNEDYEVNFDTGYVKVLSSAFFNEVSVSDINIYQNNIRMRCSYMQVWHDAGRDPEVPAQVEDAIYTIASRIAAKRVIRKNQIGTTQFDPAALNVDEQRVDNIKFKYSNLNMEIR